MQFFQKELPLRAEADPEGLLQSAYNIKYNPKKMKKLEKEYNVIKTKEQEELTELKVQRKAQRFLIDFFLRLVFFLFAETKN